MPTLPLTPEEVQPSKESMTETTEGPPDGVAVDKIERAPFIGPIERGARRPDRVVRLKAEEIREKIVAAHVRRKARNERKGLVRDVEITFCITRREKDELWLPLVEEIYQQRQVEHAARHEEEARQGSKKALRPLPEHGKQTAAFIWLLRRERSARASREHLAELMEAERSLASRTIVQAEEIVRLKERCTALEAALEESQRQTGAAREEALTEVLRGVASMLEGEGEIRLKVGGEGDGEPETDPE